MTRSVLVTVAALGATAATAGRAAAQAEDEPIDIEVPTIIVDDGGTGPAGETPEDASDIDLANVVQSAAKSITTVQEAPAIVTVITDDEIRERQFQFLDQAIDTVPGWFRTGLLHSSFDSALVRGQTQAVQFLHDSLSLFDPGVNIATISRAQPMETIKRVELITGPGGVLWGSNSLLGILNVITKDAEDVDGLEVGGTVGGLSGDRKMTRAYAMVGVPDLADGKVKLFAHGSFETTDGPRLEMPLLEFHQPLPQPNAPNTYGPLTASDQPRSYYVNFDGKLAIGKLQIRFQLPWSSEHRPLGLSGTPVREHLPEDDTCVNEPPYERPGCDDAGRKSRDWSRQFVDRYLVAEYRTRFADQKAGVSLKAYGIQFVRELDQLPVLAASSTIQGGLSFSGSATTYRVGGAIDGDAELGRTVRVLYGGEGFVEWLPSNTTRSLQGSGTEATFPGPYNLGLLPLLCPRQVEADGSVGYVDGCPVTFIFAATRTVFGAYVNPQWRPSKKLIVDVGARVQVSPGALGNLSYAAQPTFSAALVYEPIPDWHVKVNVTQGFRPPVFNNTNSNGEAVQVQGDPDLEVETSDAVQAEINARIFKGSRRIRELSFRADYSYTRIENLVQVEGGAYTNTGDRAINSGELLAKLFVQGGHRFELGYTWLRIDTADKGRVRTVPEHWFNLGAVFNLVDKRLTATTNLRVTGATEDYNRIVEYRDVRYDADGNYVPVVVTASETVVDRLPPIADLEVGLTWTPTDKLLVRGTVFNALNGHYYQPDAYGDLEPHLEFMPSPYEDVRAYLSATYQY